MPLRVVINVFIGLVLVLMPFVGLAGQSAAEAPNVSGHIVTRKGVTINFTGVEKDSKVFRFEYGPEKKRTIVELAKIESIAFGEDSMTANVRMKGGMQTPARSCCRGGACWSMGRDDNRFLFRYWDEVAQKEQRGSKAFTEIARIVVGQAAGNLRQCPHCHSIWPDDYLFCPFDGHQTAWFRTE